MARCDATEGWPRYDGKVGSAVAGRLRVAASQAAALRCGGSAAETTRYRSYGAQGLDGAHQCCRAGGGGGGGGGGGWRRVVVAARGQFSLFSPHFLLFSSSPA